MTEYPNKHSCNTYIPHPLNFSGCLPLTFSQLFDLVSLRLCWSFDSGYQFLLLPEDFLLLHIDELPPLHHLYLNLFLSDPLSLTGCLKLIGQFSLSFLQYRDFINI